MVDKRALGIYCLYVFRNLSAFGFSNFIYKQKRKVCGVNFGNRSEFKRSLYCKHFLENRWISKFYKIGFKIGFPMPKQHRLAETLLSFCPCEFTKNAIAISKAPL